MEKNYLPIGSVVLLKNAKKKLMITGFYIKAEGYDNVFDYSGCLYPEGIVTSDQSGVFNHDQIDQVIFKGYESEEETAFKQRLYEAIAKDQQGVAEPLQPANVNIPTLGTETPAEVATPEAPVAETVPVTPEAPVAPAETPIETVPLQAEPVQEVVQEEVAPVTPEVAVSETPVTPVQEVAPVQEAPAPVTEVPAQPSVFEINENV